MGLPLQASVPPRKIIQAKRKTRGNIFERQDTSLPTKQESPLTVDVAIMLPDCLSLSLSA